MKKLVMVWESCNISKARKYLKVERKASRDLRRERKGKEEGWQEESQVIWRKDMSESAAK